MWFSDHLYSLLQIFSYINFNLSIHAPAKGATMGRQCVLYITRISIHAPAKGATSHVVKISLSITYFNPRSREGSDYNSKQSLKGSNDFNPRSREGSDEYRPDVNETVNISIHAPAKGATQTRVLLFVPGLGFQSTLPRRERRSAVPSPEITLQFQSTLPRRERLQCRKFPV